MDNLHPNYSAPGPQLGRGVHLRLAIEKLERHLVLLLLSGPAGRLRDGALAGQACLVPLWLLAGENLWGWWLLLGLLVALWGRNGGTVATTPVLLNFMVLCAPMGYALAARPLLGLALLAAVLLWSGVAGRCLMRLPG